MKNKNETNPFSDNNLIRLLDSDNKLKKGAAEFFLGVCRYPEDYWIMPDYYYPGLESLRASIEKQMAEMPKKPILGKTRFVKHTPNDSVLMRESLNKDFFSDRVFHGVKSINNDSSDSRNIEMLAFNDDETITFKDFSGQTVTVPWGILCGVFLKARELGYSRPDSLDAAGPYDKETRQKWLANQEKIKELQSKIEE